MSVEYIIRVETHDLYGEAIDHDAEPKVRAYIRRNSYNDQCELHTDAWTPERGWARIADYDIYESVIEPFNSTTARMQQAGASLRPEFSRPWRDVMTEALDSLLNRARRFVS